MKFKKLNFLGTCSVITLMFCCNANAINLADYLPPEIRASNAKRSLQERQALADDVAARLRGKSFDEVVFPTPVASRSASAGPSISSVETPEIVRETIAEQEAEETKARILNVVNDSVNEAAEGSSNSEATGVLKDQTVNINNDEPELAKIASVNPVNEEANGANSDNSDKGSAENTKVEQNAETGENTVDNTIDAAIANVSENQAVEGLYAEENPVVEQNVPEVIGANLSTGTKTPKTLNSSVAGKIRMFEKGSQQGQDDAASDVSQPNTFIQYDEYKPDQEYVVIPVDAERTSLHRSKKFRYESVETKKEMVILKSQKGTLALKFFARLPKEQFKQKFDPQNISEFSKIIEELSNKKNGNVIILKEEPKNSTEAGLEVKDIISPEAVTSEDLENIVFLENLPENNVEENQIPSNADEFACSGNETSMEKVDNTPQNQEVPASAEHTGNSSEQTMDKLLASADADLFSFEEKMIKDNNNAWLLNKETIVRLKTQSGVIFETVEQGGEANGYKNQCSILALNVDSNTVNEIQQAKLKNGETFADYIAPNGLASDDKECWDIMADKCQANILVYEQVDGNRQLVSAYKGTEEHTQIKRVLLKNGHYVELILKQNQK